MLAMLSLMRLFCCQPAQLFSNSALRLDYNKFFFLSNQIYFVLCKDCVELNKTPIKPTKNTKRGCSDFTLRWPWPVTLTLKVDCRPTQPISLKCTPWYGSAWCGLKFVDKKRLIWPWPLSDLYFWPWQGGLSVDLPTHQVLSKSMIWFKHGHCSTLQRDGNPLKSDLDLGWPEL